MKKYIIPIILALAVIASLASYHKGYKKGISKAVETIIERVDTLTLHDTLTTAKPYYIVERIVDSITVKVPVVERDTILVNLPRTQKVYQDSTYRAVVSGFAPNLDTITVYRKTQYINNTVYIPQKDGRRDFFEVDARVMYSGSPYAPVTANIGRKYGPFEVYAGGGYDFMQKAPIVQVGARARLKF